MMLNHKACAIIKQRSNRVVFQEEQINGDRTRFRNKSAMIHVR